MKQPPPTPTKPFSDYSPEELAMERLFIRWVQHPEDAPIRLFWQTWLEKHPEMRTTIETAAKLVRVSSDWTESPTLTQEETHSIWGRIRSSIGQVKEMEPMQTTWKEWKIRFIYYRWYLLALLVVAVLSLLAIVS